MGVIEVERYIYVVGCTGVQAVKIGVAADCAARLTGLQCGCPLPLALLWSRPVPDAQAVEQALHKHFSAQQVRGEWFDLGPDAVRLVREACERMTAGLPLLPAEGQAEPEPEPLSALTPAELIYRDAGRWYASLTDHPEYVSLEELLREIRAIAGKDAAEIWAKLSDRYMVTLIQAAYAHLPEEYQARDGMIPLRTIAGVWEHQKLWAQIDPRIAPHYGISPEDAKAKGEALRAARKARELAGATS